MKFKSYNRPDYTCRSVVLPCSEQGRRGRHDSIDGSACDAGSCPPSVQSMASINSPIYEDWSEAPPGTYDMTHMNTLMLQMPLNAAQRPLAAVRPHVSQSSSLPLTSDLCSGSYSTLCFKTSAHSLLKNRLYHIVSYF